jgi:hypothetical protein
MNPLNACVDNNCLAADEKRESNTKIINGSRRIFKDFVTCTASLR